MTVNRDKCVLINGLRTYNWINITKINEHFIWILQGVTRYEFYAKILNY